MAKPHFRLKTGNGTLALSTADMTGHMAVAKSAFGAYAFNGWLPNPDPVLKKLGQDISVYTELLSDGVVGGHVRRRKATVAGLQWRLDGDDVPAQVMATIDAVFSGMDIYRQIKDMLNAPFFGYQPIEIIWQKDKWWLPESLVAKPQQWFNFDEQNRLQFISKHHALGEPVAPVKFLCPTHEASYINPYGRPDLAMVFWPTTFRRAGLKFWAQFTEKYGAPWLIGHEPRSNTQQDTDKLLDALEALIGNSVGTIPNDSSVEIKEATGKAASVDAYDKLIRMCRSETAIALLGQDQTTEKDSTNASAMAGLQVTEDIRDSDKRIVENTFNQLIELICDLNFGDVPRPTFELYEEEAGDKDLASRDQALTACGVQFSASYWKRAYNLADEDMVGVGSAQSAKSAAKSKPVASFAETANEPDAGLIMETQIPDSGNLNQQGEALTATLVAALHHGVTADNVLDRLVNAYPDMDDKAIQDELARLLFLAELVGRIEATEELAP